MSDRKRELKMHLKEHSDVFGEHVNYIWVITDRLSHLFEREMVPDVYEGDRLNDEAVLMYFKINQRHSLSVSLMDDVGMMEWFYKDYETHKYDGSEEAVTIPVGLQQVHRKMIEEGHIEDDIESDGPWRLGADNGM